MSRILLWVALVIAALAGTWVSGAFAAPAALDCGNVALTAPSAGATLSGPVDINGRALVQDFRFYKVEYSPLGSDKWVLIGTDVVRRPVGNGLLVVWQTTLVPDGAYALRLHVVDSTGNFCPVVLSPVTVQNAHATEPEAPASTETPMLTVVPPQPTATPTTGVAVEFAPVRNTPGSLPTKSSPVPLPDTTPVVLVVFFVFGALATLAVVLFVGVVMFVRRFG
jgi:hypothetical protein